MPKNISSNSFLVPTKAGGYFFLFYFLFDLLQGNINIPIVTNENEVVRDRTKTLVKPAYLHPEWIKFFVREDRAHLMIPSEDCIQFLISLISLRHVTFQKSAFYQFTNYPLVVKK